MAEKNNVRSVTEFLRWQHTVVPFLIPDSYFAGISPSDKQPSSTAVPGKKLPDTAAAAPPPDSALDEHADDSHTDIPPDVLPDDLNALADIISSCGKCALCEKRNRTVFGEGAPDARIMFIGEGPGAQEDRKGRPFVGPAGRLLTDIIEKGLRLTREDVYIANIVKCRPSGNRDPFPEEAEACLPYLEKQISLIQPEIIILLGKVATRFLVGFSGSLRKARTMDFSWEGIPVLPTYHPSALLRNERFKRPVWDDMKTVIRRLDLFEL